MYIKSLMVHNFKSIDPVKSFISFNMRLKVGIMQELHEMIAAD